MQDARNGGEKVGNRHQKFRNGNIATEYVDLQSKPVELNKGYIKKGKEVRGGDNRLFHLIRYWRRKVGRARKEPGTKES